MGRLHELLTVDQALTGVGGDPDLIVAAPRFATGLMFETDALGVSRQRFAHVPLLLIQNKMYAPTVMEFVGKLEGKLRWAKAVGAAAAFTWLSTRHLEFTKRSGVAHHFMPFAADTRLFGKYADEYRGEGKQPFDVGFTGAADRKYPVRHMVLRTLLALKNVTSFVGTWGFSPGRSRMEPATNGSQFKTFGTGSTLSREAYAEQIARTKMWISTTGPDFIVGTRYFEILASGSTLLLCNRPPRGVQVYDGLIEEGVHAAFFSGVDELRAQIWRYQQDEPARLRIVDAAAQLARRLHSWDARARFMTQVAQEAMRQHPPGEPWYRPPSEHRARAPLAGCFTHRQLLLMQIGAERTRPKVYGNKYSAGYNVSDCVRTCRHEGWHYAGLLCGGLCSGDIHSRAHCFCLRALPSQRRLGEGVCGGTCSLHDDRPCGSRTVMAVYNLSSRAGRPANRRAPRAWPNPAGMESARRPTPIRFTSLGSALSFVNLSRWHM